jgi:hypothetical protein
MNVGTNVGSLVGAPLLCGIKVDTCQNFISHRTMSQPSHPSDDADDEDGVGIDDVEYGIRRPRRYVTLLHRDSSSLYPSQIMEVEYYLTAAQHSLVMAMPFIHLLIDHASLFHHVSRLLAFLQRMSSPPLAVLRKLRGVVVAIKNNAAHLTHVVTWVRSHGEIALLYAGDLIYFVRNRRQRFQPMQHRRISEISRSDCDLWFGLTPFQLRKLFKHLRIPARLQRNHGLHRHNWRLRRHVYDGEESFLIYLFHLRKGMVFTEMARHVFGGDPRNFSEMFDMVNEHLYMNFYNKIAGTSLSQWLPRYVHRCRRLIHSALSDGAIHETQYVNGELVNERWISLNYDFDTFRPFGFIDDYALPTAKPSNVRRTRGIMLDLQRSVYSGYQRKHGLKAQLVYLPIGLIGCAFVTEIRQNDNGVQNISGLNNYLYRLLMGVNVGGLLPCLSGDSIFAVLVCIVPSFRSPTNPIDKIINTRMNTLRVVCEHINADHVTLFQLFRLPRYLRLYRKGSQVRRLCLNSFFLQNCYYCIRGTRCRYFGQIAPTLEDYIPVDEVLVPPPAVDLGVVYRL